MGLPWVHKKVMGKEMSVEKIGCKVFFHCLDALDETFLGLLDVLSNINARESLKSRCQLNNGASAFCFNFEDVDVNYYTALFIV
ncbi:hypothetical protein IEQ34_001451 [Dendrobium chrysotoxum]|uniref:Uncharacterized protein n=1 Tax=Dendrobium chrysotoxum TaxID=161865 RepID=A0AAV7HQT7_DENCH|nr:hypothetical protein IEQ34_001451 [Dendrobium chrysotoxum]